MKKLLVFIAAWCFIAFPGFANAQVHVGIEFNLGIQPMWGPVGYDYVDYYFLPGIDVYYSVPLHRFYYFEDGQWVYGAMLPPRYRDYDLYHCYKVVVNEREPWRHNDRYRARYAAFRDRHDQPVIRDSRDSRYFVNRHHPEHENWLREQRRDNGNHYGWNRAQNDNGNHYGRGRAQNDNGNRFSRMAPRGDNGNHYAERRGRSDNGEHGGRDADRGNGRGESRARR